MTVLTIILTTGKQSEFFVVTKMLDTVCAWNSIGGNIPGHCDNTLTEDSTDTTPREPACMHKTV